jgi:hypothetical protein
MSLLYQPHLSFKLQRIPQMDQWLTMAGSVTLMPFGDGSLIATWSTSVEWLPDLMAILTFLVLHWNTRFHIRAASPFVLFRNVKASQPDQYILWKLASNLIQDRICTQHNLSNHFNFKNAPWTAAITLYRFRKVLVQVMIEGWRLIQNPVSGSSQIVWSVKAISPTRKGSWSIDTVPFFGLQHRFPGSVCLIIFMLWKCML